MGVPGAYLLAAVDAAAVTGVGWERKARLRGVASDASAMAGFFATDERAGVGRELTSTEPRGARAGVWGIFRGAWEGGGAEGEEKRREEKGASVGVGVVVVERRRAGGNEAPGRAECGARPGVDRAWPVDTRAASTTELPTALTHGPPRAEMRRILCFFC